MESPYPAPPRRLARRPMRPTPVLPDARLVTSLAEQRRSARHRRARRRGTALVALVALPAALAARPRPAGARRGRPALVALVALPPALAARLAAGSTAEPAGAASAATATTP